MLVKHGYKYYLGLHIVLWMYCNVTAALLVLAIYVPSTPTVYYECAIFNCSNCMYNQLSTHLFNVEQHEYTNQPQSNPESESVLDPGNRSRVVDMMGRLHVDLFLQDKFSINGVDVKIQLVRSKNASALMAGGANPDYKIQIVNATLFAKKATLIPSVQMSHTKALEKSTVKYPKCSVGCKKRICSSAPKCLVLCCIDNASPSACQSES